MTKRIPTGEVMKERIVTSAIKDVLNKGETDIKYANASKVAKEINLPERTTRHLIRNDQQIADIAELRLKYLSDKVQDFRIKLSDVLDEKLADEEEVKKTSLYQATKAYGLIIDKEWALMKGGYLNRDDSNKIEIILKKE